MWASKFCDEPIPNIDLLWIGLGNRDVMVDAFRGRGIVRMVEYIRDVEEPDVCRDGNTFADRHVLEEGMAKI